MKKAVDIEEGWAKALADFFKTKEWDTLTEFIREEYKKKKIYPDPKNIFKAFWLTPFDEVKVVILGQDPYHGAGQAEGLCFSVPKGVPLPPSLKNIYKEIEGDLNIKKDFKNGHLEDWAKQGVFLFNAILTVVASSPASHKDRGWEEFTDFVIKTISEKHEHVVFMLWGNYARSKKVLIDAEKHLILEAPHPSPFSAYNGFFGSKHFSECNDYLMKKGKKKVQW
ncbi:MAG: uracil-DNA glycosylase [bacterium]|nr:uracil-DNA glycosylase [bacterium]